MANTRPSLDELTQRRKLLNGLYAGTYWRHVVSHSVYRINSIALREADYEPKMNYSPVSHPDMEFSRPLNELLEMVGTDEMPHPRFARVDRTVTYG